MLVVAGLGILPVLALGGVALAWPASAEVLAAASITQVDTSPATSVVAVAPQAVSVTFSGAPDPDGISLTIIGPDGEVSSGQPQLVGQAIRRTMDEDVPGGRFEVRWKARSPDGDTLSGSFEFIAARGNGIYASEPARPTGFPTAQPTAEVTIQPAASPSASLSVSPSASPSTPVSAPVTAAAPGPGRQTGSLSAGWKLVPIALGAILVLASAGVGMLSTARRGDPGDARHSQGGAGAGRVNLFARGGLALPWNRHQS